MMNHARPSALVVTTAGINCDVELGSAFEMAGAAVDFVHLNRLMARPELIERYGLVGLPGGFSYGDAIAAGRIASQFMRLKLYQQFARAVERGVPIFAPCNGFQMAVQIGLLPGPVVGEAWPDEPPTPTLALAQNASARFIDRWCRVEAPASTRCIWTQDLDWSGATAMLPVAHGEGRFCVGEPSQLDALESRGQIAVRYAADDNPNGSAGHVAGICDASGLVFGLMPHPERYTKWLHHPFWTRLSDDERRAEPPGLQMFRHAVAHATSVVAA